jgi:dipeptidase E
MPVDDLPPVVPDRLLVSGGGGFLMQSHPQLDLLLLSLCKRPKPRICFIPTASGDSEEMIERFYERFRPLDCKPTHLAFFRRIGGTSIPPAQLAEAIPEQDVVFVGGGNTRSMLPVWREWGLPDVLARANGSGTLIAGMSAGAICWFSWALSDSVHGPGTVTAIPGLGWLAGGAASHFDPSNLAAKVRLQQAALAAGVDSFIALPDGVAALFEYGCLRRVYCACPAVGVWNWIRGEFLQMSDSIEICSI